MTMSRFGSVRHAKNGISHELFGNFHESEAFRLKIHLKAHLEDRLLVWLKAQLKAQLKTQLYAHLPIHILQTSNNLNQIPAFSGIPRKAAVAFAIAFEMFRIETILESLKIDGFKGSNSRTPSTGPDGRGVQKSIRIPNYPRFFFKEVLCQRFEFRTQKAIL